MQLPQFQTPGVFLKRYFQNNPKQLNKYVQVGLVAAKLVVTPLSAVLKHLIEVQGMDPNTESGRRMREDFQEALNRALGQLHNHEYDSDFDFSWLNKKFKEAHNGVFPLDLSKDDFKELTDVSHLNSPSPVVPNQSPVDELADLIEEDLVNPIAPEPAEQVWDLYFGHDISKLELPNDRKLKDALERLVWIDKDIEEENEKLDPKELFARTDYLKKLKKDLKQYGESARPLKKGGKIRRTKTGNTKAVKKVPRKSLKSIKKTLNKGIFSRTPR